MRLSEEVCVSESKIDDSGEEVSNMALPFFFYFFLFFVGFHHFTSFNDMTDV